MENNNYIKISNLEKEKIKLNKSISFFEIFCNKCESKENFFKYVEEEFKFPNWFGKNWDAFDDSLMDLELKKDTYVFIYDLDKLFLNEVDRDELLELFFKILNQTKLLYQNKNNRPNPYRKNPNIKFKIYVIYN